ncbi:MAG: excisionase family DNA-binding protein [Nitrospirota bacterium]
MGFLAKLFKRERKEELKDQVEDSLEPKVHYEDIPGTLDLGWYWSENKEEFQMAKIAEKDRATHFYVVGATGTGKTKFLEFLIQQDITKGNGFGVIDPHSDLIEDVKGLLACYYDYYRNEEIFDRVVLIDPTDSQLTVTFNPLERLPSVSIPEQANELISAFKKIWSDSWGVRMEDLMRNSLIALGEAELPLTELSYFLINRAFRKVILEKVSHPIAKEYFKRFDTLTDRGQVTWIEPVMNKINAFFSDERIRQMFSSQKSSFNLREMMDQRKILLIKLDKGKLKDSADLLGSLLMAKIQMTAFSRADLPQSKRTPFYPYIDEFQNFAGESFAVILSEARKYGLSLIMAHQTLSQIPDELRSLILGNTGIQVYFRLNRHDASLLAKEAFEYSGYEVKAVSGLRPIFWTLGEEWEHHIAELQSLPPRVCYAKHKIEGGIIPFQTVEIEPVWEVLGIREEEYQEFLRSLPFGRKYLVEREKLALLKEQRQRLIKEEIEAVLAKEKKAPAGLPEDIKKIEPKEEILISKEPVPSEKPEKKAAVKDELLPEEKSLLEFIFEHPGMFVTQIYKALGLSGYKGDKLKEGLIEKGLIIQEETREGAGGRLAKVFNLTNKGLSILKRTSLEGKGGDIHKHLQMMIKEQAELFGWKATIEERIPKSLESVDVGLRKDDMRVAIEISLTSKPDQEIQNIRKCLETGYDYVISVFDDEKGLSLLKTEAKKSFTFKERERIRFCLSSQVKSLLVNLAPAIVSEKAIVSEQILKEKQLMDTREASEFLGISKNTLYEWIIQKRIPYVKVGRLVKFRQADLETWLKKRTQEEEKGDFIS